MGRRRRTFRSRRPTGRGGECAAFKREDAQLASSKPFESFAHRVFPTSSSVPTAASAVGVLTRARSEDEVVPATSSRSDRGASSASRRTARIGRPASEGSGCRLPPADGHGYRGGSPSRAMPAGSARTSPSVSFRRRDDPTAPCVRRFASERGTSTRTRFEGTPPARSDAPGRRRRPAARRPRARQSNRGTPTPKRERKREQGRQPPATRREVPRALTRSPLCPLVNRGRARRRARRRPAKSRASAWSSSDDDDDNNKDSVPASARARHPERLHRGGKGAEGVPSSRTRQASASAAETEALRESFGDLRVREARSRDGGRGRGGGRGGPRW